MRVVQKFVSLLLAGAAASLMLAGCHGGASTTIPDIIPPTVDFSTSVATSDPSHLTINFSGVANNIASGYTAAYSWNFGDGSAAVTTQNATYAYKYPGTYAVTLTVLAGTSASRTQEVTVTCTSSCAVTGLESWAWTSGSSYANSVGTYETQQTASTLNQPSARQGTASWRDAQGRLWMFGGGGYDSTGANATLNDLWRFNPTSAEWTWVSGSNRAGAIGVYGNMYSTSIGANIGARAYPGSWADQAGNMWLFGGQGYDSAGTFGYLNDLWKIDPTSGAATWMGGSNTANSTSTSANWPAPRAYPSSWVDTSGTFWMFGGQNTIASSTGTTFNDLWYFNPKNCNGAPSTGSCGWTQVASGSVTSTGNTAGNYGTRGAIASTNWPGSRVGATTWTTVDQNGIPTLWLFGGTGYDSTDAGGVLNDLWSFNTVTHQWTWVAGNNTVGGAPSYGTMGALAASGVTPNMPGARLGASGWVDATGRLWMFGGGGYDSTGVSTTSSGGGDLNDLWVYNPNVGAASSGQWVWMGGSNVATAPGVFSAPVAAAPTGSSTAVYTYNQYNTPGARLWATAWTDAGGHVWLFGGSGIDLELVNGALNDLWVISYTTPAP